MQLNNMLKLLKEMFNCKNLKIWKTSIFIKKELHYGKIKKNKKFIKLYWIKLIKNMKKKFKKILTI